MQPLRVAVIGQGRSGYGIHLRALASLRDRYRVVAVCDPLPERTREAVQEHGAVAYSDWEALLDHRDTDLVVVASPSHLHVAMTAAALERGHHVVCDKPLARRAADVDALVGISERVGKRLTVFQQSRFAPYFRQVRAVMESGVLGRIVLIKIAFNNFSRRWDWQTLQEYGGGSLLNTGPHPMDQALELLGSDVMPAVTCVLDRVNTSGDAEDFVKILLRAPGRPLIDLEISSADAYPRYSYHIHGQYGGLTGDMSNLQWKYYRPEEAPRQALIRAPLEGRLWCSESLTFHEEKWTNPHADMFDHMAVTYYRTLREALARDTPFEVTPQQVRRQVAVMEECHRQNPLSRLGKS